MLALGAGIALRILNILAVGPGPHWDFCAGIDEAHYRDIADNIIKEKICGAWLEGFFLSSLRAPFYPLMLAAAKLLGMGSIWVPQILNMFLEIGNLSLLFLLGKRLGRSWETGAVICAAYALFGPATDYLPYATPEILGVFLLLASSLCLLHLKDAPILSGGLLALFYALLIHTRPAFLPVMPFLGPAAFIALAGLEPKKRLLHATWPFLLAGLFCLPWALRNWQEQGTLLPVSSVAGWHMAVAGKSELELSENKLLSYVYTPEHRAFKEGDFFRDGQRSFFEQFAKYPFKILGTGALRIRSEWLPKEPWKRIFLPKAYVKPVKMPGDWRIPMPDLEGSAYLFVFALTLVFYAKPLPQIREASRVWLRDAAPLIILLAAYTGAHLIAVPLTQYRFIIEPCLLLLALSLLARCLGAWKTEELTPSLSDLKVLTFLSGLIVCAALMPLLWPSKEYTSKGSATDIRQTGEWSYQNLREWQWANKGLLPEGIVTIREKGRIRQLVTGLRHFPGLATAERAQDWSTGRIIINAHCKTLGDGDAKVNFQGLVPSDNEEFVEITGEAALDIYGGIIITVRDWKKLEH